MQLHLEVLEDRFLPAVSFLQSGTILSITGDNGSSHNVLVRPTTNVAGSFDVVADGQTTSFTGLTQVNYQGGNQGDVFTNRVKTLPGTILVGNGANVVYTIATGSVITAGNGNNILQVTGGNSTITAGNGDDSVYGGPGDIISVGSGKDVVYDILPGNQTITVAPHDHKVDHLFIGPQSTLLGNLPQDHVAQFFVAAPLGSGTLAQSGSTLYFAGNNNGDRLSIFGNQDVLFVLYDLNNGAGFQFQVFTGVNQIAAFGGSGNDYFANNSTVDDVMYGAGGSNVLLGGFGQLDLEKAGGQAATGSIAIGRSPVANDLNGSGQTTTTNTLIFAGGPHAKNIARSNSPTDVIIGLGFHDTLVSLYPDFVIASLLPPVVPA